MDRIVFPKKIAMTVLLSCALLLTSCYSGSKLAGMRVITPNICVMAGRIYVS